jgi:plastocyanin
VALALAGALSAAPAYADETITAGPVPNSFGNPEVTVDQGELVTFRNSDPTGAFHDVTATGKDADGKPLFASDTIEGGKTEKRVFTSEAKYWDKAGPVSWDMAMTVTKPDWKLRVRSGDKIRINAVYDAEQASWYENMGIVMALVAPGDDSGVDVFSPGAKLDTIGEITHGRLPENDNHGGENPRPLPKGVGPITSRINISNYVYKPGDLSMPNAIPRVRANRKLTFFNADDKDLVWHTITTCAPPCSASTGISYPLANAMPAIDSLEVGLGLPALGMLRRSQPASGKVTFSLTPRKAGLRTGQTYTYFCRIHPFMRGAFKVVK